eukprot:TRINITY_DN2692_c0_g1_i2.p1 TRINITY_DN2692_c0_g1~~TRINITY_DN2692_c0_g1_i2.p1  ORF type:complete len:1111 (+),score=281.62 TRINITY_DN2692_c0_g1_i2:55-3387(+)
MSHAHDLDPGPGVVPTAKEEESMQGETQHTPPPDNAPHHDVDTIPANKMAGEDEEEKNEDEEVGQHTVTRFEYEALQQRLAEMEKERDDAIAQRLSLEREHTVLKQRHEKLAKLAMSHVTATKSDAPLSGDILDYINDLRMQLEQAFVQVFPSANVPGAFETILMDPRLVLVHALCNCPDLTLDEIREMCSSLLIVFESHNDTLRLLKWAIASEVAATKRAAVLFREDNIYTQLVRQYLQMAGRTFLHDALGPIIRKIAESRKSYEIEESRIQTNHTADRDSQIKKAVRKIGKRVRSLLTSAMQLADLCPSTIRDVCHFLKMEAATKFVEGAGRLQDNRPGREVVGAILFLRFICPAIIMPESINITCTPTPAGRRGLVLVAKVLQHLANASPMEGYTNLMADVLSRNRKLMSTFLDSMSSRSFTPSPHTTISEFTKREAICFLNNLANNKVAPVELLYGAISQSEDGRVSGVEGWSGVLGEIIDANLERNRRIRMDPEAAAAEYIHPDLAAKKSKSTNNMQELEGSTSPVRERSGSRLDSPDAVVKIRIHRRSRSYTSIPPALLGDIGRGPGRGEAAMEERVYSEAFYKTYQEAGGALRPAPQQSPPRTPTDTRRLRSPLGTLGSPPRSAPSVLRSEVHVPSSPSMSPLNSPPAGIIRTRSENHRKEGWSHASPRSTSPSPTPLLSDSRPQSPPTPVPVRHHHVYEVGSVSAAPTLSLFTEPVSSSASQLKETLRRLQEQPPRFTTEACTCRSEPSSPTTWKQASPSPDHMSPSTFSSRSCPQHPTMEPTDSGSPTQTHMEKGEKSPAAGTHQALCQSDPGDTVDTSPPIIAQSLQGRLADDLDERSSFPPTRSSMKRTQSKRKMGRIVSSTILGWFSGRKGDGDTSDDTQSPPAPAPTLVPAPAVILSHDPKRDSLAAILGLPRFDLASIPSEYTGIPLADQASGDEEPKRSPVSIRVEKLHRIDKSNRSFDSALTSLQTSPSKNEASKVPATPAITIPSPTRIGGHASKSFTAMSTSAPSPRPPSGAPFAHALSALPPITLAPYSTSLSPSSRRPSALSSLSSPSSPSSAFVPIGQASPGLEHRPASKKSPPMSVPARPEQTIKGFL